MDRERELDVSVTLPVLVKRIRLAVAPLDYPLDRVVAEQLGQLVRRHGPRIGAESLADRLAGCLDRAAGHVRLARGRTRPR